MRAHGFDEEAFEEGERFEVGVGVGEDGGELGAEGGEVVRVGVDVLEELGGELGGGGGGLASVLVGVGMRITIGVAVVEETKVMFMSWEMRLSEAWGRARTRPWRMED